MIENVAGPAFPFSIDPATGGVAWARGAEKVRHNVRVILGTRIGERPLLRDFGSRLHALIHEPNDVAMAALLRRQAQEALMQWEPRILTVEASVEQNEGEVGMRIRYVHSTEPSGGEILVPLL